MSTPLEEQENEIEVLQSIYEDNFHLLSTKLKYKHFEINLHGHACNNTETVVSCTLYFKYTSKYPSEGPHFEIRSPEGISDDQNAELVTLINEVIERSVGAIMIFDIVSEVQQKLDEYTDQLINDLTARKEKQAKIKSLAEAEREKENERKLCSGTPVTVESFNAWNKSFLSELAAKKEAEEMKIKKSQSSGAQPVKRLTGREMFLRDDQFDESDLKILEEEGGEIVEVDEKLFVDIGDLDLSAVELDDFDVAGSGEGSFIA
nr:RWD domain containing protein 1 [Hymenolepis microstoma]